jgi:tol-pal system protein YbgF
MAITSSLKHVLAAAFLAAASIVPLQSQAALFSDDEARRAILDLRSRVEALQREISERLDAKADKVGALDLNSQNEALRDEVARLRGQVEILTNELANAQQRQKDLYVDLDNRLRKFEPQKMTVDGQEAFVDPSEQKAYDAALALFRAGDYKNAGTSFAEFLRRYPESGYGAAAQYWLGNTYYVQREYRKAITAQQAVVKNYPDNPRAADALLNIATCPIELKVKASAKKTLQTLISKYGDSPAAQTARERLRSLK